jgi:hypothetical protein
MAPNLSVRRPMILVVFEVTVRNAVLKITAHGKSPTSPAVRIASGNPPAQGYATKIYWLSSVC